MEATVIDFILSTLMSLSAQYPDAAWIVTALSVVMTVCLAAHFGQNKGAVADGKSETVKAEVKAVTGK